MMETRLIGEMREDTFNTYLAPALRARRKAWRDDENSILAEQLKTFDDAKRERPDILVNPPDFYPVVIEVEFGSPAIADARKRLGRQVSGTALPVRSAIAVGVPPEVKKWSTDKLTEELSQPHSLVLRFVVLSANVQGDESEVQLQEGDVDTWPAQGWVSGNIDDLATLCEYAAAPAELVSKKADGVAARIHSLADQLYHSIPPDTARSIALSLGQNQDLQGLRMACCIWLTSLRMHNLLATGSSALRQNGLRTVATLRENVGGVITLGSLRDEWDKILAVNYSSIFHTARTALHPDLPDGVGSQVVTELGRMAEEITALRLGNRVDFAGELFPKLLDDREETAAHYTLPETAELLSHLAVDQLSISDWSSSDQIRNLEVADMACGTGALLRATYRQIRRRHEAAGGDAVGFHRAMIGESITGLDINSLATHMTAAGLSTMEIETEYETSRIAAVAVAGGKTGSLELLNDQQITDVTGENVRTATTHSATPTIVPIPNDSYDIVIQNPPYLRARGDRKMFDVTGISESERKRSVNRLRSLRSKLKSEGNEIVDGQAGLGADFSALADMKLKRDGVFATVLPLTAAHAESWEGFRKSIEREYRDITAIAFAAHDNPMMSADTYIGEMLLLAKKGTSAEHTSILTINLSEPPTSLMEAFWFANLLEDIQKSSRTSDVIQESGKGIGNWTRVRSPRPGFPWFAVGMRNHHLAAVTASLMEGSLYDLEDRRSWNIALPFGTLDKLVEIGPTHHLIGHTRGAGEEIGAFTFDRITPDILATYPALWAANAKTQTRMLTGPTHSGEPSTGDDGNGREHLAQMLSWKSDLFISRTLRMTSQALAVVRTPEKVMGGRAWTALRVKEAPWDDSIAQTIAIWCNSTLGLLLRASYAQTTQAGRATMQIRALGGLPIPDFAARGEAGEHARATAQRHFPELSALNLEPIAYAFRDKYRQRIDEVALEMLGLGRNERVSSAIDTVRRHWCREPSVNGSNRAILCALERDALGVHSMWSSQGSLQD